MYDVAQVVTLVGMNAAEQNQHPLVAHGDDQNPPTVSRRGGRGEAGQLGHRDDVGRLTEFGGRGRPSRAEHHGYVERVDAGAGP